VKAPTTAAITVADQKRGNLNFYPRSVTLIVAI